MKILITLRTGYCGMDAHEFFEVPDDMSEDELSDICWEMALENAARYGIYDANSEEDSGINEDNLSYNIEGSWELYNSKEHDGNRIGGEIYWNQL
jgi:hypothetical protein